MKHFSDVLRPALFCVLVMFPAALWAGEIDRFVGSYSGMAEFDHNGKTKRRDMSTTIRATNDGFVVKWVSVSYKMDGSSSEKSYTIEFVPSQRDNIYGSAMRTNVFGKPEPLDPLNGEPFVWARFDGDTFTLYSLGINELGEYEMQEFHRSLTNGGLDLMFRRVRNGEAEKEIHAFLAREE